ncbi:PAAR domain-containing protein [Chondromyces crocatus]|uniref:Double-stranded DNA deaminase toxin A prePAAR motif domain-containing protein n=1 Tax=Chondromyces crocatus TaxID=52 RepID=A0A0K1ECF3_CHOCO|nr:PAAR domain-containing protein [Chondromyces crocatus]AKT38534.1 uncharacterized protein CMC5_026810 [Chondromyces crocatus]
MATPSAARVGDPIEHSHELLGALAGIAVGLVVGAIVAATIIATAGTGILLVAAVFGALSAVCTGAAAGFSLGKLLKHLPGAESGVIGEGARSVFIGEGLPPAARALDKLACGDPPATKFGWALLGAVLLGPVVGTIVGMTYGTLNSAHAGAQVAMGSETVYIEQLNAARVKDETSCGGKIIRGSATVGIGGPQMTLIEPQPEVPEWLEDLMEDVDKAGVYFGLLSGFGGLRVLFTKGASIRGPLKDFAFAAGDYALFELQGWADDRFGEDSAITQTIAWGRTGYEVYGMRRTYRQNRASMGAAGASSPTRAATPPSAPTPPRAPTPPSAPTPPRAPTAAAPTAPTAPRPVPQGGQTIAERAAAGGRPPPYAQQNPGNYYFDPSSGRYKRR